MRFVIVTGMSGSGKITAIKMLEDAGFYCVDNLPVSMLEEFVERVAASKDEEKNVALGIDVRIDGGFQKAQALVKELRQKGYTFEILYMESSNATIIRRYKESRRMHPLAKPGDGSIEDGIIRERDILQEIKAEADYIIDTSMLLTRELKEEIDRIFIKGKRYNSLMINVVSFGFKKGIPVDADLVFDVRFLPNPFYIEELKELTGNDKPVQDYVMQHEDAETFLKKLSDMLEFLLPGYRKEGKHQLVIAIGCTGGQHRSVTLANELFARMRDKGDYGITITHRDARK